MKTAQVAAEEPPGPQVRHVSKSQQTNGHSVATDIRKGSASIRSAAARFCVSERSADFLHRYYPDATVENWNDWRWQNRNRVRTLAELARMIELSAEETEAIKRHTGALPVGITPYYASLLDPQECCPGPATHRRTGTGRVRNVALRERRSARRRHAQPGARSRAPLPGPRAAAGHELLLGLLPLLHPCPHGRCSVGERSVKKSDIELALDYIEQTPVIRDVLISGGDPLSLDDDRLEYILRRLQQDPACRVHPHRQQAAGRAADAHHAGADAHAEALPPAVDEPAFHAPGRD